MRDHGGRQVLRPRRRHAVDPLHGLHPGLLKTRRERLQHRRCVAPTAPLHKTTIAPAAHQQMLTVSLQRCLAVLPRQQQRRRIQRLKLQCARGQQLLRLQDCLLAEPGHRNRAVRRLRTVCQRDLLQVIQQHRLYFALQCGLQPAARQWRQLQFQQDQVLRIETGQHLGLRMTLPEHGQALAAMGQHPTLVHLRPLDRTVGAQVFQRRQAHPQLHAHAPILVHTRCTRTLSSRYSRQIRARKSTALPSACTWPTARNHSL